MDEISNKAEIALRKEMYSKVFTRFMEEETNKGTQPSNLTFPQRKGMASLKKRIDNKEIFVTLTDKSGKLCVAGS